VISCGWLGPPANGRKDGTNYLLGSAIHFTCNQGYELAGTKERICQATGAWSGDSPSCILRSGLFPFKCYKLSLEITTMVIMGQSQYMVMALGKSNLSFGEDIGHETPAHLERLIFKSK